jgi:hypothetical protein
MLRDAGDFAIIEDRTIHRKTTTITVAYNLEREKESDRAQYFYKCDKEGYLLGKPEGTGLTLMSYSINELPLFHRRNYCQDYKASLLLGIPYTGANEECIQVIEDDGKEKELQLSYKQIFTNSFDAFCRYTFEYETDNSILYSEILGEFFLKRYECRFNKKV